MTLLARTLPLSTRSAMPLRAKILNARFMSTANSVEDDVLFGSRYSGRIINLNRPKKLNALNTSMVDKLIPRVTAWKTADVAKLVIIKGEGKALCAGGDVAAVVNSPRELGLKFFADEYLLDYIIATYQKPVVTFMNGITMGGGAGLCMHAPYRIGTENTVFAMPETLIGFYPDVGASFFLSRLDGELGTFLAVTGERLNGFDAYFGGFATHVVNAEKLPELEERLCHIYDQSGFMINDARYDAVINSAISDFQADVPHDYVFKYSGANRKLIDDCFKFNTLDEITAALTAAAESSEFAKSVLDTISLRCPLSMKTALVAVRKAKNWNIKQALKYDVHAATKFLDIEDFKIGVTYRVIEKQNGRADWKVKMTESEIEHHFFPKNIAIPELEPYLAKFEGPEYEDYPFQMGLPRESEIRDYILGEAARSGPFLKSRAEIVEHFMQEYDNKTGLPAFVNDVLDRKTKIVKYEEEELLNWK